MIKWLDMCVLGCVCYFNLKIFILNTIATADLSPCFHLKTILKLLRFCHHLI